MKGAIVCRLSSRKAVEIAEVRGLTLRIAQLIQTVDVRSGGTSTAFLNSLAALRTRPGLSVRAFSQPPPADDPAWETINAARDQWVLTAGVGRGLWPGPLGRSVIGAIGRGEMDLLHIHGVWSPDLLGAALACLKRGVPYVWEPHGMLVREAYAQKRWKKEAFMLLGMRRALRGAAGLVFVTSEERETSLIPSGVGPEKLHVAPLPVQVPLMCVDAGFHARARDRFGIPHNAPCVVFMGRLHPVKRIEWIFEAAEYASRTLPELRLLLVGGGDDAYVRELKDDLATREFDASRAIFAGWVHGDDKWLALAAGDVLTLNSVHENFGFVAVEALCVGAMPVLTSNLALAAELRVGNVAEIAAPDTLELSKAWERAIAGNRANPVLERGRAWLREHLSVEAVGERLERVYRAVRGGSGD